MKFQALTITFKINYFILFYLFACMYVCVRMKVDLQVFMCISCIQGPVEARFSQSKVTGGYELPHKI